MRTIEVYCIVVSDEVYAALEREVKELGILAASCATPFNATMSHVINMAINDYGTRLMEGQKKADPLAYTE
ncbi:hypothetical protein [Clostridium sp.]